MIVVTGASGLLGASVLLHARDLGHEVAGLCHSHPLQVPGTSMHCVDLTDFAAARTILLGLKPQTIIHCAAATKVDWCEDHHHETEMINIRASANLVETARDLNAKFVYISTDAVFDGRQGNYSETDGPSPINVYGHSKLSAEREVFKRYASALIARINIYGWNAQNKTSLAEWFLRGLESQEQVPGFTDVTFCPMLVNDLAEALFKMLDRQLCGIYHVVGSERISKYEFGRRLATAFGLDPQKVVAAAAVKANFKAQRPLDISLCTEKVSQALGVAMPNVEAGLSRFQTLYREGYPQQLKSYLTGVAV